MLGKRMEEALNAQVNREMYSAFLYMAMSSYSNEIGLKGFANWFMVQYHEEMLHAMKMFEYIQRTGGTVKLSVIDEPPSEWNSALDMFEQTYTHEKKVTAWINELMEIAIEEKDHASQIFVQWYVTEQVEEEENDTDIIAQLKIIKDDPQGLILLDRELAGRMTTVFTDFSKGIEGNTGAGA